MLPTSGSSANLYSWMYVSGRGNPSTPESVSELNHNHFLSPELQDKLDVMVSYIHVPEIIMSLRKFFKS